MSHKCTVKLSYRNVNGRNYILIIFLILHVCMTLRALTPKTWTIPWHITTISLSSVVLCSHTSILWGCTLCNTNASLAGSPLAIYDSVKSKQSQRGAGGTRPRASRNINAVALTLTSTTKSLSSVDPPIPPSLCSLRRLKRLKFRNSLNDTSGNRPQRGVRSPGFFLVSCEG